MAKKEEETTGGGGPNTEKLKALQAAMDKIEKNFGKGSIMKLGDDHVEQVDVIPTGSIALNAALAWESPSTTLRPWGDTRADVS